jgi:hypothetical protein
MLPVMTMGIRKELVKAFPVVAFTSSFKIHFQFVLKLKSSGTLWSCVAHIITAVIGAGVLSLAWSTSQLGWIAGPVSLLCFAIITYISAFLLSDCYRSPDSITGTRNYSYVDAVRVNLGSITPTSFLLLEVLRDLQVRIFFIKTATFIYMPPDLV